MIHQVGKLIADGAFHAAEVGVAHFVDGHAFQARKY